MKKRNTVQKTLIFDTVVQMHNHPTADEVYDEIHMVHPSISRTTVYRNLNSLVEDQMLTKVLVQDSADRFDHNIEDHHHLKCISCKSVVDIELSSVNSIYDEIEVKSGFKVNKCGIVFIGKCPKCHTTLKN